MSRGFMATIAATLGLLAGLALGAVLGPDLKGQRVGPPIAVYGGETPSEGERSIARDMLNSAQEELKAGRVPAARQLLVSCVELADLPMCHRVLGTLLGLTQNPSAEAHLLKYLKLSGPSPDAALVRDTLAR